MTRGGRARNGLVNDPNGERSERERDGQTYYFCNETCLERFQADPTSPLESRLLPVFCSRLWGC